MKSCTLFVVLVLGAVPCFGQVTAVSTLNPVPLQQGIAKISPANSRIDFVGTHEGPKPDPRKGGFSKFTGEIQVADDGGLTSVSFDIDTRSLWTEIPKLTGHLKNADFFDVREHPKASFRSTAIASTQDEAGYVVTGELTLLKVTKEIKIPVSTNVTPDGMTLSSKFKFDRTQFGMTYGQGKVSNDVQLAVAIGKPSKP